MGQVITMSFDMSEKLWDHGSKTEHGDTPEENSRSDWTRQIEPLIGSGQSVKTCLLPIAITYATHLAKSY